MTALRIIGDIIVFLFILPVFTGQVVNIGNLTGLFIGALLIYTAVNPFALNYPIVILLYAILAVCVLIAIPLLVRMAKACRIKPDGSETLIILGCEIIGKKPSLMQVERLQAGSRYLTQHPEASVICSGGRGKKELISEAEAMKRWLCARGIDPDRIYLEDKSETTAENIRFSAEIMKQEGLPMKAAICSNEFHLYRAFMIASKPGIECRAVPAPTAWWLFPTFTVRELYAILYRLIMKPES